MEVAIKITTAGAAAAAAAVAVWQQEIMCLQVCTSSTDFCYQSTRWGSIGVRLG